MKSTKKRANRARKDLTFVPGNEIMDLNNERRLTFNEKILCVEFVLFMNVPMEQWDLPKWFFPMMKILPVQSSIGQLVVEW